MKTIRIACPKYARIALTEMGYHDPHSLGNHGTMPREMSEAMAADARAARADVLVTEEVAQRIRDRVERFRALGQAELEALLARPKAERPFGRVGDIQRLLAEGPPADPSGYVQTEPQWLDVEPEDVIAGRVARRAGRPSQRCSLSAARASCAACEGFGRIDDEDPSSAPCQICGGSGRDLAAVGQ